jgi:hypothetical protein
MVFWAARERRENRLSASSLRLSRIGAVTEGRRRYGISVIMVSEENISCSCAARRWQELSMAFQSSIPPGTPVPEPPILLPPQPELPPEEQPDTDAPTPNPDLPPIPSAGTPSARTRYMREWPLRYQQTDTGLSAAFIFSAPNPVCSAVQLHPAFLHLRWNST